jgi:hypothetical protein
MIRDPNGQDARATAGVLLIILLGMLAVLAGCGRSSDPSAADLKFPTEYQAVFLANGQAFFGKLESIQSGFLTFKDVFYVQRQVDPQKKEAKNVLLKRGSEWHGPEAMRINLHQVVIIEPVAPNSRVAQLIKESRAVKPSETKEGK